MHVADVGRRLLRRRPARLRLVLIGCATVVVLAVAGGAIGWGATSTTWTSRTAAVLVPPESDPGTTGANPLLRLDTGLVLLTPVLATAMDSPTARTALRRQGATAPFRVDTGAAPLVRFVVEASSPAVARRTAAALLSVARDQLDMLQSRADADGAQRATLLTVLSPTRPVRRGASRSTVAARVAVVVAVVAALAVLGLALLTALRRRRTVAPVPRPSTRRLRRLLAADANADTHDTQDTPVVPRTR